MSREKYVSHWRASVLDGGERWKGVYRGVQDVMPPVGGLMRELCAVWERVFWFAKSAEPTARTGSADGHKHIK